MLFGQKVLRLSWCIASIWSEFAICVYTFGNHHHLANNPQWSIRTEGRDQNKKESPLEILPPQWAPDTPLSLLNWKASLFYIFHDLSPTPHCDSRAAWFSTASTTFDVVVLLVSHQEFRLEVVLGHHLELRY